MTAHAPAWVEEAARLPVAFAQVREDALLDLAVLDRVEHPGIRAMMIASGGCTAAALVASNRLAELHLVDPNPAQIALSRLKIQLLQTATPSERQRVLGHAPMDAERRGDYLAALLKSLDLPLDIFGPVATVASLGLDHAGRYERVFARLRAEMGDFAGQWPSILGHPDAAERIARTAPHAPLGQAMDRAFDRVMAMENLVHLFGAAATQNSAEPFSRHFAARTRHALATLPTADNPFLWQLLTGHFPAGVSYPWLTARPPERMPNITIAISACDDALSGFRDHFDFVHLSNILDWLSCEQAEHTLRLAWQALRPGGFVFIRQLNSTLNLRSLGRSFQWQIDVADALHARDRSFFYRLLHLGRKP